MFLANSLKEKLKRNFLENETDNMEQTKFPYKSPPKDPRVLLSFRQGGDELENQENLIPQTFFSTQKLQALDRKEWEKTFTVDKLHSEWKTRVNLDFENNYKKISDEFILPSVIQSKIEMNNLRDPDRLELKQKQWNISYNVKDDIKPELQKKLFEIQSGLKDFKVVPIKTKSIEEGVDSRDHLEVDGNIWNVSNQVNLKDFKTEDDKELYDSKENTLKYWKTNNEFRKNEQPFPIPEEKKKIEVIRYFKKYRTPYQKNIDYYRTMQKIKDDTFIERENAEKKVKYRNPGSEKYPEKINALVLKEMYNTYQYKYNEVTGKLSKEELKRKQREKNRFKWSDADLANKILAVNKLTGEKFFEKAKNKTFNNGIELLKNKNRSYSQENERNTSYLLPLVAKGTEIHLEEEKIQEKLDEEFKKKRKRELLLNKKTNQSDANDKFISKYPLSKTNYEIMKNSLKDGDYKTNDIESNKIDKTIPSNIMELIKTKKLPNQSDYLNKISQSSNCGPFFLEAYNKVAEKEIRRIDIKQRQNKLEKTFEYKHPGTYREFVFMENDLSNDNNVSLQNPPKKKVVEKLWSCCMNKDKDSRGCQKVSIRNFRWIYEPQII